MPNPTFSTVYAYSIDEAPAAAPTLAINGQTLFVVQMADTDVSSFSRLMGGAVVRVTELTGDEPLRPYFITEYVPDSADGDLTYHYAQLRTLQQNVVWRSATYNEGTQTWTFKLSAHEQEFELQLTREPWFGGSLNSWRVVDTALPVYRTLDAAIKVLVDPA